MHISGFLMALAGRIPLRRPCIVYDRWLQNPTIASMVHIVRQAASQERLNVGSP
jgi:hypothetical protein